VALAESGDAEARHIVDTAGAALGAAIARLVNVLDPHAVVIGGGLGLVEGLYRRALADALRGHLWSELHRRLPLRTAELRNDAGLVGAALAAADGKRSSSTC
jgi:glucokinase